MTAPVTSGVSAPGSPESAILATALAASGLDPWMMFAGLVGGLWSLGYLPAPLSWYQRVALAILAAFVGAWIGELVAPPLAALAAHSWDWWPPEAGGRSTRLATSLIVGLLAHRQIGPALMRKTEAVTR